MEPTVKMMKGKLHRATITESVLDYEGSIGIDTDLLRLAGILPHEAVHVWNLNSGQRWETYTIPRSAGSGEISINGAAARLSQKGDLLIIAAFCWMPESLAVAHTPRVVLLDGSNRPLL